MGSPNVLLASDRAAVYSLLSDVPDAGHRPFEITRVPTSPNDVTEFSEQLSEAALFAVDVAPNPVRAIQLSQAAHSRRPGLPIVAIACCPQCLTLWTLQELVAAGVGNIVDFRTEPHERAELLCRLIDGETVVHLELGGGPRPSGVEALEQASLLDTLASFRPLSEGAVQILQLLSQGMSDREIGHTVHISEHTVKHHIERLRGMTCARNRIELAAWAGRRGFAQIGLESKEGNVPARPDGHGFGTLPSRA